MNDLFVQCGWIQASTAMTVFRLSTECYHSAGGYVISQAAERAVTYTRKSWPSILWFRSKDKHWNPINLTQLLKSQGKNTQKCSHNVVLMDTFCMCVIRNIIKGLCIQKYSSWYQIQNRKYVFIRAISHWRGYWSAWDINRKNTSQHSCTESRHCWLEINMP
jgi:hypothetical protein